MDPAFVQSAAFMADPTPKAVVDGEYVVRAVNPAYCRVTAREQDELMSRYLFDAFPDNPDDPDADGVENAIASFDRVLRTGLQDNMLIQRHDIANPRRPGEFMRRDWMPVHSPLRSENEVVGILVQINDVTLLREDVRTAMEHFRMVLADREAAAVTAPTDPEHHQRMVDALTGGLRHFNSLANEVTQLREALTTRGMIEQAKGMLMLSQKCGPDEAFEILRRASRDNTIPLADVATAVVAQLPNASQTALTPAHAKPGRGSERPPDTILTPREEEVVTLIAQGSSSKEIAQTLMISVKTVDRHRSNILRKLGRDQAAMVRYAIRAGLVEP